MPDKPQLCLIPSLTVNGADKAIAFYQVVFGAKIHGDIMHGPSGKGVMHAELKIGEFLFFVNDEFPQMGAFGPKHFGGTPVTLNLYVEDCDKTYAAALASGAEGKMPPANMFWGDRYASIVDPWGHRWGLATKAEQLTPEHLRQRVEQFNKEFAEKCK